MRSRARNAAPSGAREILELGGDDAHFFAIALHEKMFVRVLANRRDETFAQPLGDAAADDDDLGIERVGQVAGEQAQVVLRVLR